MNKINILVNKYLYLLVFTLFIIQSYFYINHINNDYKLLNEYRYIDETSLVNGKEVLNSNYIDNNLLFKVNETENYTSSNNIFFYGKENKYLNFNNIPNSIVLREVQFQAYEHLMKAKLINNFSDISYNKEKELLFTDYKIKYNGKNNSELQIIQCFKLIH